MSIWWILLGRLRKHSVYHLIIPLGGGILVEALVGFLFSEESTLVRWLGLFWFRTISLVLGVFFSWLVVMIFLISHETKKRIDRRALAKLQATLDKATGYYGVSIIPLTEWFDPAIQLYWTKLLQRKMEARDFQHERTLLFFSNREYKNSQVALVDENHYGRCLAFMHGDCGIPLSFLERKEIFEILTELSTEEQRSLGCFPSWTNWGPLRVFQKMPLHLLRRRIPQLDFALVTRPGKKPSVLRISKHGEEVGVREELKDEKAAPYRKFLEKIRARVYDEDERKLRLEKDFLTDFDYADRVREKQEREAAARRTEQSNRRIKFEQLLAKGKGKFRIRKCTRLETISDKSGDVNVRMAYEAATGFPKDESRDKLPISFTSKSGFYCEPKIIDADGAKVGWEWDKESLAASESRQGFVTFDPPVSSYPVSFTLETHSHNAIHFSRRDRQEASGSAEECIRITTSNHYDLYVLKVRFPTRQFPRNFKIHAIDDQNIRDYQEEKFSLSRFAAFEDDSLAVLILERPLPGYTYEIAWRLPEDDVDGLGLSGHPARIVRETIRRLLALRSQPDQTRLASVKNHLNDLKDQIANATIGSQTIGDPDLELVLHAYSEEEAGLVMVTSNGSDNPPIIGVGRSTVGQAFRRRALVRWTLNANHDDSGFWDYGTGHTGIVSIPLFYPLDSGGRTCVISIATKSPTSHFLGLIAKLSDRDTRRTLTQHINAWYAKNLASALRLPDLSKTHTISDDAEEK